MIPIVYTGPIPTRRSSVIIFETVATVLNSGSDKLKLNNLVRRLLILIAFPSHFTIASSYAYVPHHSIFSCLILRRAVPVGVEHPINSWFDGLPICAARPAQLALARSGSCTADKGYSQLTEFRLRFPIVL